MSYRIKLLPEARLDIKEIIEWYNGKKRGLGKWFYESLKSRIDYIRKNPLHYQVIYRDIRNAPINRFPYQVHYRVEESDKLVIVFGVTHTRRDPRVWKNEE